MTITIYELLGMFKKGKFPKKIRIYDCVYIYDEDYEDYIQDGDPTKEHLFDYYIITDILTDTLEIIEEEKKIGKFNPCIGGIMSFESVENIFEIFELEINELIDEINQLNIKATELQRQHDRLVDEINKLKERK